MSNIQIGLNVPPELLEAVQRSFPIVQGWLATKLRNGRCSSGLIAELALCTATNQYNVFAILDLIGSLEGTDARRSGAKPATKFKHPPLRGLSKAHHLQATFLPQNLLNELKYGNSIEKYLTPRIGQEFTQGMANQLAHEIVIGGFNRRSAENRMTGEWLVFEEAPGGNYYLTLANHNEEDAKINDRITHYRGVDAMVVQGPAQPVDGQH